MFKALFTKLPDACQTKCIINKRMPRCHCIPPTQRQAADRHRHGQLSGRQAHPLARSHRQVGLHLAGGQCGSAGKHGGGTALTSFARRLIALYRALEKESQLALEKLTRNLHQSGVSDVNDFRQVLERMFMKTSARNQFTGTISSIHVGPVNAEVTLDMPGSRQVITAVITVESVRRLGLIDGLTATAVFKASSVFLAAVE